MSTRRRVGWPAAVCGLLLVLHLGVAIALALGLERVMDAFSSSAILPEELAAALASLALLTLLPCALLWLRSARLPPGTMGRGRLMSLGAVGAMAVISGAVVEGVLVQGARQIVLSGLLYGRDLRGIVRSLPAPVETALVVSGVVTALAAFAILLLLVASWFLIEAKSRARLWGLVDLLFLAGMVHSTLRFPLDPSAEVEGELLLAVVRLTLTTLFIIRLLVRLMPVAFDAIERFGFQSLVASRHLRAKKSGFLAVIGMLSILAVGVSSMMLITVLSVMGGFRNDLKQKILGYHAHVVIDRQDEQEFDEWRPVLEAVASRDDVVGASPFVSGEVMVTSATNSGGAILRGIDPESVRGVTALEENLTTGRFEYLLDPARLLDLPPEERRRGLPLIPSLGPPSDPEDAPEAPLEGDEENKDTGAGSFLRDVEGVLDDETAEAMETREAGRRAAARIAELLKEEDETEEAPRDVLPGVIVGQELARSLRIYVGDEIDVISPLGALGPTGPVPKTRSFRVAGVFYSGMYEFDMKYVYTLLPTAQSFLNTGDRITGIEMKLEDVEDAPAAATAIRASLDRQGLRVRDWQEMNRNLFGALELEKLAMFIALGIAVLIAGFCVFGTLTLMVQEKGREVGILKAMGAPTSSILRIFIFEGFLIGILGAAMGLGLGFVATFAAEHFGIRMSAEVYYIDRLPVHIDPTEFAIVGLSSVLVCVVATVLPAVVASRLNPVDALRYE